MLIAGGVYVEKCVAPETTQLLGSGGRAALALSGMRNDLTLHTFHPPSLWNDLRANFAPFGIAVEPHPAAERITFSYLFPLGRPVQTPARLASAGAALVEDAEILSFGCIEGHFVARGRDVVHDFQGAVGCGFRTSGSSADRLALILNRQESMVLTGSATVPEAAASLLRAEGATVIVVKDGPRGAAVFDTRGSEAWIPPYRSSRLYKIGSGDVFSATFAHSWLMDGDAATAADRASRQTAAYVEGPVLPLVQVDAQRQPRRVTPPGRVYVAAHLPSLAHRWLAAAVDEALRHIGIEDVEIVDLREWMNGWRPAPTYDLAVLICLLNVRQIEAARRGAPVAQLREVIFVDEPVTKEPALVGVYYDLSQALYELCWEAA